jgi:hypothetical protein
VRVRHPFIAKFFNAGRMSSGIIAARKRLQRITDSTKNNDHTLSLRIRQLLIAEADAFVAM